MVDYDVMSSDEMGFFVVPPDMLYRADGEREVFKLKPPPRSRRREVPGHLAIRCRRATEYDKEFLKELKSSEAENSNSVSKSMSAATAVEGGKSNLRSILSRNVKVDKNGVKKVGNAVSSSTIKILP